MPADVIRGMNDPGRQAEMTLIKWDWKPVPPVAVACASCARRCCWTNHESFKFRILATVMRAQHGAPKKDDCVKIQGDAHAVRPVDGLGTDLVAVPGMFEPCDDAQGDKVHRVEMDPASYELLAVTYPNPKG
ncbi:hypothetical protein [Stenotrophomonas maltophilia]|uniref:hypothetical protein n=1 Tax=Stenotrophomonas maltophilia TaxID=40324 RepID=UPI0039C3D71A